MKANGSPRFIIENILSTKRSATAVLPHYVRIIITVVYIHLSTFLLPLSAEYNIFADPLAFVTTRGFGTRSR